MKKKKIGIITINGYDNFGNRLQNYASEQTFKKLGFDAETLLVKSKIGVDSSFVTKAKKILKMSSGELKFRLDSFFINRKSRDVFAKREKLFLDFSMKYINEVDHGIFNDIVPDGVGEKYDFFSTGSDQVWNPNYTRGDGVYFLSFADKEKRISYSASFGVPKIEENYFKIYSDYLTEMEAISVRENEGAEIVKKLTGREAAVLLDPTMMLTKNQWLNVASKAEKRPKSDYLLTYFLGYVPRKEWKEIECIAKKNKLEIVNLMDVSNHDYFISSPGEFIDYINNASLFLTNSFHGAVFSILLEVPFAILERETKTLTISSRIDTLMNKFKLENRKWSTLKNSDELFNLNYLHVESILEIERNKSFDFLNNAFKLVDNND